METFIVAVFLFTYLGMGLGRIPGLRIDRTGIALFAAVALLAIGRIDVETTDRWIDAPTLMLLLGLMIISAQFSASGAYDLITARLTSARTRPGLLLGMTVGAAALLSAVLSNDITAFAMAPIVALGVQRRGLDPRPFLIGLAGGCNAGSAATIIGNPQNILIGQSGGLDFWRFVALCAPPAVLATLVVWGVVWWVWRRELSLRPAAVEFVAPAAQPRQIGKGVGAIAVLILLFATDLPHEVSALAIAALLLMSRSMASREMLGAVDWHLLLLFACLFIVTGAFSDTGLAQRGLDSLAVRGFDPERLAVIGPLMLAASNTIGNVPAVILLLSIWPEASPAALHALALLSTLAGNLLIVGSLANIIVVERAAAMGVRLGFGTHARCGIPMTLLSMALAAAWLFAVAGIPF